MISTTGDLHIERRLLVWSMPIRNEVHALFTMIFLDVFQLIDYICKVLTNTDTFHLIVPLNCFENLFKNSAYLFPQVVHIDVICDGISDVRRARHRYSGCEKVQFHMIYDLLGIFGEVELHESMKDSIISLIEDRIAAKQSDTSIRRSQILTQFACTSLYGFPVKNNLDFAPCFICPCCELVYRQVYQLECKHHHCQVCINIQKK